MKERLRKGNIMVERVGNVALNYKHYAGRDLYSDGNVEQELLDISKKYGKDEWNRVIAEKASWPVLYHFSHIRENITDWLPISKEDTVLEIGSGCGAITGNLAKKAKHVTCIDLSRMRSLINANRNRDCDNIEILVGNFQDIEKDLDEKYDYITLIGVFEYSAGYIGTEKPYTKMLEIISHHLKPNGKLIIAIENRLGMKYWAGCTEDHVGKLYEGIEGYPNTSSVKTFSHKEMGALFEKTGIYDYQMYYPYPDYKFPLVIYSDEWLPKVGELSNIEYNFDRARIRSFDETKVFDTIIQNDLFPVYSNSFLIVASLKGSAIESERCIYAKFSNERANDFSLKTMISQNKNGKKIVEKVSASEDGSGHIKNIHRIMRQLDDLYRETCISVNRCSLKDEGIELEYLEGTTLEQVLDCLVAEKKFEQVWSTLERYLEVLRSTAKVPFKKTDEFVRVFGDVELPKGLLCPKVNNIDAICGNILWGEKEWNMLDYEWSFSFPVPVNYQIYRVIHYYLYLNTSRGVLLPFNFYERARISENEIELYNKMEENFQNYILGIKIPIRNMYCTISQGVAMDVKKFMSNPNSLDKKNVQIYYDKGQDFSEDNSIFIENRNSLFKTVLTVSKDIQKLRIDPCSQRCLVKVNLLKGNHSEVPILPYICNGERIGEQKFFFDTVDPYFIVENIDDRMQSLNVELQILWLTDENCEMLREQIAESARQQTDLQAVNLELQGQLKGERDLAEHLRQELAEKKELISQMQGTKVWKLYRMLKGDVKKRDLL